LIDNKYFLSEGEPMKKFRDYLKKKELSDGEAAKQLDLTKSYIQQLRTGGATPGLHAAAKIKKWSGGEVTFESWLD
jgi:hypothetical protein